MIISSVSARRGATNKIWKIEIIRKDTYFWGLEEWRNLTEVLESFYVKLRLLVIYKAHVQHFHEYHLSYRLRLWVST